MEKALGGWTAPMNAVGMQLSNNGVGARRIRFLWAISFATYLALAIVSAVVLHGVFVTFVHLAQIINIRLGRPTANAIGGYAAFCAFVLVLTVILAGLFGLVGRILRIGQALRYVYLIITLAAAPVCWFYVARWHGWFPLEVLAFTVSVLLVAFAQWTFPRGVYVLAFSLHFGFWGLRFWQFTHNPAVVLLPFVGFCSAIAWISSLDSQMEKRKSS